MNISYVVLKLHPALAPYKAVILPLIKKNHAAKAQEIYDALSQKYSINYDDAGNIGKRYRRNDAIGTPYAITIDEDTLNNGTVTLRDRDTMTQKVIKVEDIEKYIDEIIKL